MIPTRNEELEWEDPRSNGARDLADEPKKKQLGRNLAAATEEEKALAAAQQKKKIVQQASSSGKKFAVAKSKA
jgi:hypothetical protein